MLKTMNEIANSKEKNLADVLLYNKNLILHGAPGTGKTYMAKEIASFIIFGKSYTQIERTEEERLFNEQTEFVQFHPSYDYSDFVEGLRPIEREESGDVGFERKDGVFKEFCERALNNSCRGGIDNFKSSWELLVSDLTDQEDPIEIPTITGNRSIRVVLNSKGTGLIDVQGSYSRFYNYSQLYNVYRGFPGCEKGGHDNYRKAIIKFMKDNYQLKEYSKGSDSGEEKKYVFIIDEINRGEISRIFGELFFSIDPDYRGPKGRVRTQYANMVQTSNEFDAKLNSSSYGHFFVPENVYIIGTMNDIDRSVESMDFAMRRRFTFVELKANECIDMIKPIRCEDGTISAAEIKNKMNAINEEIEIIPGLSSAYHIGGSYFSKLEKYKSLNMDEAIKALWNNHLEPLIKDYLRGVPNSEKKLEQLHEKYLAS